MDSFKKHIAFLFLLGFLFPQVANAVHHFVVSHEFQEDKENNLRFTEPAYEYHSCDYHLSGIKFIISDLDYSVKKIIPEHKQEMVTRAFLLITEKAAFNFSVRGPPFAHNPSI